MWIAGYVGRVLAGSTDLLLDWGSALCWGSEAAGGSLTSSGNTVYDQLDLVLAVADWPVASGLADDIDELE